MLFDADYSVRLPVAIVLLFVAIVAIISNVSVIYYLKDAQLMFDRLILHIHIVLIIANVSSILYYGWLMNESVSELFVLFNIFIEYGFLCHGICILWLGLEYYRLVVYETWREKLIRTYAISSIYLGGVVLSLVLLTLEWFYPQSVYFYSFFLYTIFFLPTAGLILRTILKIRQDSLLIDTFSLPVNKVMMWYFAFSVIIFLNLLLSAISAVPLTGVVFFVLYHVESVIDAALFFQCLIRADHYQRRTSSGAVSLRQGSTISRFLSTDLLIIIEEEEGDEEINTQGEEDLISEGSRYSLLGGEPLISNAEF